DVGNHPTDLVPGTNRRRGEPTLKPMQVAAANAAVAHLDHHLAGARRRSFDVAHLDRARVCAEGRLHAGYESHSCGELSNGNVLRCQGVRLPGRDSPHSFLAPRVSYRFKLKRVSANRYSGFHTRRFRTTNASAIVNTPAARRGKSPAAVAWVISDPRPCATRVCPL